MTTRPIRFVSLDETNSTNAEGLRRAAAGEHGPLWISAASQTEGRGRSGRVWRSLPGNLFASLIVTPDCDMETASQLALLSGVAMHDAVAELLGVSPHPLELKWPNDLLLGGAKIAGVLLETARFGGDLAVVIGFGLNIASHPDDSNQRTTSLAAEGIECAPDVALRTLAKNMDCWLQSWSDGKGFERVRQAWLDRAGPTGRPLRIRMGEKMTEGVYAGLDTKGALRLDTGSGETRVTAGDVFFR